MEVFTLLLIVLSTIWVYSDAKERGSNSPVLWACGTLCLVPVFLPLYIVKRPARS